MVSDEPHKSRRESGKPRASWRRAAPQLRLRPAGRWSVRALRCSPALKHLERGQGLAFEHLEEGATARGDVAHLLLDAVLGNRRQRVARRRLSLKALLFGNRPGDLPGAVLEGRKLEHTHRPVPHDGAGGLAVNCWASFLPRSRGPMSRIRSSASTSVAFFDGGLGASALNSLAVTTSTWESAPQRRVAFIDLDDGLGFGPADRARPGSCRSSGRRPA